MATRFWVGGTGTWDAITTTHWAATSGGAGGQSVPVAADTVTFDGSSGGGTVTTLGAQSVTSLTLGTGWTGTVLFGGGVTVSGAVTVTQGTLNTNGQTCTFGTVVATVGSLTRNVTLGTSSITVTGNGGSPFMVSSTPGITISMASATIILTGNAIRQSSTATIGTITMTGTGTCQVAAQTCGTFNYTPAALVGNLLQLTSYLTCTVAFNVVGLAAPDRVLVAALNAGTPLTITCNGTVTTSYCDFEDITAAGTASWDLHAATGGAGDCGGNTGITFTTGVTSYWVGGTGNWSDPTHWASSSGGTASTGRNPLAQDSAVLDANSGISTSTITQDCPRQGGLNATNYLGKSTSSINVTFYGSVALCPVLLAPFLGGAGFAIFAGRGAFTFATNGRTVSSVNLRFLAPGGTYTLQDDLIAGNTALNLQVIAGTFDANGHNVTVGTFTDSATVIAHTLKMGTGTWTLIGTGAVWLLTAASTTLVSSTSTLVISDTTSTAKTFTGAGLTYGTLSIAGPGATTIQGANSFFDILMSPETQLVFPASTTTTIRNTASTFGTGGTNYGYEYLHGIAGNYASTSDAAPLQITSDIDLRCQVAMDNWIPAATNALLSKYGGLGFRSYQLYLATNGHLILNLTTDGSTGVAATSSVATGFTNGTAHWIRATWKQTTSTATFYTSSDGVTWAQLGTTATLTLASIFNSTAPLEVGTQNTGGSNPSFGKFYRAQVYNGIAGTLVFDANFATKPFPSNSFTESSSNAATVTINGQAAQAGDGRVLIASSTPGTAATISVSSGTINLTGASIQDNTATGGATFFALSSYLVSNDTGWLATLSAAVSITASLSGQPAIAATPSASISLLANPPPPSGMASGAVSVVAASAAGSPAVIVAPSGSLSVVASLSGSPAPSAVPSGAVSVVAASSASPAPSAIPSATVTLLAVGAVNPSISTTASASVSILAPPPPASGSATGAVGVVASASALPAASALPSAVISVVARASGTATYFAAPSAFVMIVAMATGHTGEYGASVFMSQSLFGTFASQPSSASFGSQPVTADFSSGHLSTS